MHRTNPPDIAAIESVAREAGVAPAWHACDLERTLERLGVRDHRGLSDDEAASRRARVGPNRLPRRPPASAWRIFARQLASPMIAILAAAAALSLAVGEGSDAAFIVAVIALNTIIGGTQEVRAERSAEGLQRLLRTRATVVRGGETVEIDAEDLVPGDLLRLESGARVPADARLLDAVQLRLDESLLTGESSAVAKDAAWSGDAAVPLADRRNVVFAGSTVRSGRARALVVATGAETEIGRLAGAVVSGPSGRPPLLARLDRFSRLVGRWSLVAAAVVALLGIAVQGRGWAEMSVFAIALVVAAIPEGLPVAITVALAVACRRMARRGAVVRRLGAVEGLGSCALILTDKTGTLTCNELTVREVALADGRRFGVTGEGFAPDGRVEPDPGPDAGRLLALARTAALCNEGALHERTGAADDRAGRWIWRGDPTDVALLAFARKLGVDRERLLDEHPERSCTPFEPERRYAACVHGSVAPRTHVKGAPERVLAMCDLDEHARRHAHAVAAAMGERGLRVLALAEGPAATPAGADPVSATSPNREPPSPEPSGLEFLGFLGMTDPLRPGAADTIARCRRAGITVSMVTGDHPGTALAIARELGLAETPSQVRTGVDLPADPEALAPLLDRVRVFARVAPEQKLDLVRAALAAGRFVAVTGDGVNDAPALHAANIGVAMGRGGTDVARDASDLVIADDDLATIVAGVEEGRVAYANIRKVVYYLRSTGVVEILLALAAVAAGLPLPLLPAQLLWLNLVTSGIQDVGLAFEPPEGDELEQSPRPARERLVDRRMLRRAAGPVVAMAGLGFAAYAWMLDRGVPVEEARNTLLLLMVLFECLQVMNSRSETRSVFTLDPRRAPVLVGGTAAALLVHVLAMHLPAVQGVLGTAPLPASTWAILLGLASTVVLVDETGKWYRRSTARRAAAARRPAATDPGRDAGDTT